MNERIKKLAEQAGVLADFGEDIKEGRWSIGGNCQSMEKFAELIVKECAEEVDDFYSEFWDRYASEKIKQHFGVE